MSPYDLNVRFRRWLREAPVGYTFTYLVSARRVPRAVSLNAWGELQRAVEDGVVFLAQRRCGDTEFFDYTATKLSPRANMILGQVSRSIPIHRRR